MEILSRPTPRDLEVLVVEDDPDARAALIALVGTFGVQTRGARDGQEALRLVLDRQPDLILCDLEMPRLDGFGFVRRLLRDPRFGGVLTIAVSGRAEPLDVAATRMAGFDAHVLKPMTPETLALLLDRALDVRNRGDQAPCG
jgi:two-component system cell cycle response regulator DivK